MQTMRLCVSALIVSLAVPALGAQFQPTGALGIGGAGVARTTNAHAAYWNPGALAFADDGVSIPIGVSVGLRVSKGLADNVDKLSKFTETNSTGRSAFDNFKNIGSSSTLPVSEQAQAVSDAVSVLSVFNDIKTQQGTISLDGSITLAVQIKHFAFGVFAALEGFSLPLPDMVNILPGNTSNTTIAAYRSDLLTAVSTYSPASVTTTYFSPSQLTSIQSALTASGFSAAQQNQIINGVGTNLAAGGSLGAQAPELTNTAAAGTIVSTLAPALSPTASSANSIDNNKSAVMIKNLAYVEVPLSYGHPIDFGAHGKLGLGGTIKIVKGRVYQTRVALFVKSSGTTVGTGSKDIADSFSDNFEESTALTFDLGALYKYGDWFNWGLVAKNLTSPKFKSPPLRDQDGTFVDVNGQVLATGARDAEVVLKPQVRTGIALTPWSWVTFAADLDLTQNESVLSGLNYRNRTLGGGVEFHPKTWLKFRGGMYKNLANDDIGSVLTGGITIGAPWFTLEVDGAYGREKTVFDNQTYPKEAKAQAQFNIHF